MMWGYGDGYGWGWGMGFHTVLWWILLILAIVALVRWIGWSGPSHRHLHGESALDILKKRYARGEINKDEFEQRKRDLEA